MSIINKINFYESMNIVKKIDHPCSREVHIGSIKEDFGEGTTIKYDMGNGIAIFARNFILNKDIILIEESTVAGTSIIFSLEGNLNFTYKDKKNYTLKQDNYLMALISDQFYSEVALEKNKRYTTLSLGIKEELFSQLAHPFKNIKNCLKEVKKNSYSIFQDAKIDPHQVDLLSYFKKENSYEDIFKNFYLESKTTDLIYYTIEKLANNLSKVKSLNLDINKINSLEKAKSIILNEYHKPLCIKEIAYKSAINECYLKKDFKAYYGTTIYEMLQDHRMKIAKQLLQKSFSVKEAALKVGYKHTGHFSKLFFNYFRITPSNYKKMLR
jgi:AraC-like DNA-binding protein